MLYDVIKWNWDRRETGFKIKSRIKAQLLISGRNNIAISRYNGLNYFHEFPCFPLVSVVTDNIPINP